ncbi:MAG: hypothetical protein H7X75_03420, partial [Burkholderiaceae bacterium]|nr:hypothetical protein [Burkholderiaceae bacterium]
MSTVGASETVPSSRQFTYVGVAYGLYAIALFLLWPALIGVMLAYVKRNDVPALLSSHYRWLITTFWWWFIAWAIVIGAMLSVIIPNAIEIKAAVRSEQYFNIPWELIGTAVLGGFALGIIWLWVIYRLVRGA